jgi:hypothetical protein
VGDPNWAHTGWGRGECTGCAGGSAALLPEAGNTAGVFGAAVGGSAVCGCVTVRSVAGTGSRTDMVAAVVAIRTVPAAITWGVVASGCCASAGTSLLGKILCAAGDRFGRVRRLYGLYADGMPGTAMWMTAAVLVSAIDATVSIVMKDTGVPVGAAGAVVGTGDVTSVTSCAVLARGASAAGAGIAAGAFAGMGVAGVDADGAARIDVACRGGLGSMAKAAPSPGIVSNTSDSLLTSGTSTGAGTETDSVCTKTRVTTSAVTAWFTTRTTAAAVTTGTASAMTTVPTATTTTIAAMLTTAAAAATITTGAVQMAVMGSTGVVAAASGAARAVFVVGTCIGVAGGGADATDGAAAGSDGSGDGTGGVDEELRGARGLRTAPALMGWKEICGSPGGRGAADESESVSAVCAKTCALVPWPRWGPTGGTRG